ncbi:biosynthetic-type acetolactate synthase large subunit [Solimonas variicoloris]|uniref:biosynthetic-type acetolactate synthase large subunit n=1 Tax=Solimonas variicoloris TaxID=254408 RepID=UPI0003629717|nr:biosynthetic-type acetolactate synthase large subunit [Solimonas variicoloris]
MDINGAELITRFLERRIDAVGPSAALVAGIPGGALLPLYRALADSRLTHILARHEQGAAFMAQGIARVTGRAGVCLATSGPGVTNTVTAIADAKADSVPLVCIAGQVPRALIGTDAFQEVRTGHIVESITKAQFQARSAEDLLDLLPEAFRIAESGRPGPVLLDVPKDVQTERLRIERVPDAAPPQRAPAPDAAAIAQAARLIERAQRPVLYLGGGVTQARAQGLAQAFAERAGLPTTTTLMALGTLPPDHPLALGMLGMHGARYTNLVLDECDLLIAIGARFDDRATGRLDRFAPNAQVIHIDADRRELGKLRRPELAIEADAGAALRALLDAARPQLRADWLARVGTLRREFPLAQPGRDDPRRPYGLIATIAALIDPATAITTDVGQHQMWVAQAYPFARGDRWLTSGGLGTMGFGLPSAIGAALALPRAGAVCFSGDGSLLMTVQELATLAETQANVKIVVMDNSALGLVRQQQNLFYDARYSGSLYRQPPSCCAIAEGFGVPALDLGFVRDPAQALREAFAQPGPMLIRAPIAAEEMVLPMVTPGSANIEALG